MMSRLMKDTTHSSLFLSLTVIVVGLAVASADREHHCHLRTELTNFDACSGRVGNDHKKISPTAQVGLPALADWRV